MPKQVNCPCGEVVTGADDDELVANVEAHVADKHPDGRDDEPRADPRDGL